MLRYIDAEAEVENELASIMRNSEYSCSDGDYDDDDQDNEDDEEDTDRTLGGFIVSDCDTDEDAQNCTLFKSPIDTSDYESVQSAEESKSVDDSEMQGDDDDDDSESQANDATDMMQIDGGRCADECVPVIDNLASVNWDDECLGLEDVLFSERVDILVDPARCYNKKSKYLATTNYVQNPEGERYVITQHSGGQGICQQRIVMGEQYYTVPAARYTTTRWFIRARDLSRAVSSAATSLANKDVEATVSKKHQKRKQTAECRRQLQLLRDLKEDGDDIPDNWRETEWSSPFTKQLQRLSAHHQASTLSLARQLGYKYLVNDKQRRRLA